MKQGKILIVSGPSGVGKGTVLKALMAKYPNMRFSVSATTRTIRPGEVDGVHYRFMTKAQFEELIARDALLEYASYADNYYGTPAEPVQEGMDRGEIVILEIEVQGALQVMARRKDAISIFIAPPSYEELRNRLFNRGDTPPEVAEKRLKIAIEECSHAHEYKYTVVNDTVEEAVRQVEAILLAESCRSEYNPVNL